MNITSPTKDTSQYRHDHEKLVQVDCQEDGEEDDKEESKEDREN